jgi:hypothetical protein
MGRRHRAILTAAALMTGLVLAGCETGGISDKLGDLTDSFSDLIPGGGKKKLPGDRKPVFPEGIPGVAQGVPPELVKGNQPPPDAVETLPPAKQAAVEPEKPKPKTKKKIVQKPPPQSPVQPTQSTTWQAPTQQQPPAQWPAPPTQQQPSAQWPAPPNQPPAPAAWPAPPPAPQEPQTR